MDSLNKRREKINLKFAKKCLKIENMKSLFPLNPNTHVMKNRKIVKFKENKAKKERYKKSAVLSMQKILNSDFKSNLVSCNKGTVHKLVPNP